MRRYAAQVGDAVPEWYEIAATDGKFPEKETGFTNISAFTEHFEKRYNDDEV